MRTLTATAITTMVSLLCCSGVSATRGLLQDGAGQVSSDPAYLAVPQSAPTGFQAPDTAPVSSADPAQAPQEQTTPTSHETPAIESPPTVAPSQLPEALSAAVAPSVTTAISEPGSTASAPSAQVRLVLCCTADLMWLCRMHQLKIL